MNEVIQDFQEKMVANQNKSHLQHISQKVKEKAIDHSINAIAITDRSGNIAYVNESLVHMFGYKLDELLGLPILVLWKKKGHYVQIIDNVIKNDGWVGELEALRKDSTIFDVQLSATIVREESKDPIAFMATFVDISAQKESERALQESEEKHHSIVDNIGTGVSLISPKMEILQLNNQMKKWFPTINEHDRPICYQAFNDPPKEGICEYCPTIKTLQDGQVHEEITKTPQQDDIRHFRIVSSPIFDEQGNVKAAIEMVDDITKLRRAEAKLEEANQIINRGNAVAFLWKNREGWPVEFVTENVSHLFGYSHEEFTSGAISYFDTIYPEDQNQVKEEVQSFSNDQTINEFTQTYRILTKEHQVKWIEDKTVIRRDSLGAISHYEGVIYDITVLKNAEKKVRESEKMKTEFMNIVAHELKTPLIPVQGYLEMIQSGEGLSEEQEKWIHICLKNVDNLKTLIDEILDVARLESNSMKFHFTPIDLHDMITEVAEDLQPQFMKQNLEFLVHLPQNHLMVNADERRIKQVLRNFLSNSLKSTDQGSIQIHLTEQEGSANVSVQDTGIGISPEHIDKLFQKFSQVGSSETRKAKGTGLGLYICKKIIEHHQGTIQAVSEGEGKGSTFSFHLPLLNG